MLRVFRYFVVLTLTLSLSAAVFAQTPETTPAADTAASTTPAPAPTPQTPIDTGNTAWMLISSALVLMMTAPGLAMFYGGLVRKKNILSVMMQCIFLMGMMSVLWCVVGYSLAFAPDILGGFVGGFDFVMLKGVIPTSADSIPTNVNGVPMTVFMVFQGMFFIITPGLICGAFAERMKFSTMCVFSAVWGILIYCPVAHWVWSDTGFLCEWNANAAYPAIDFAGGTVVHITSGISALVCCLLLGKRIGYGHEPMPPHNLTYTSIGAALLWVGWFGFNAGTAGAANALAANAFCATHFSAAAGVLAWSICEWFFRGKPSVLGACSGAVAGLVCVTPASGSCSPVDGLLLGLAAGVVCYFACTSLKQKFGYDDSLDAFGVHGVGGILGALLTGVFARKFNVPNHPGLLDGHAAQLVPQIVSILASAGIAIVGTVVILKVLDIAMGLRVSQDEERQGLDVTQHGEEGYIFQ